jgi:hypothetical protein
MTMTFKWDVVFGWGFDVMLLAMDIFPLGLILEVVDR